MKYGSCQCGVSSAGGKNFNKMLGVACASRSDDWNRDRFRNSSRKFAVKARARTVTVHGCEQDFSRAAFFGFTGPRQCLFMRSSSSSGDEDLGRGGGIRSAPRIKGEK